MSTSNSRERQIESSQRLSKEGSMKSIRQNVMMKTTSLASYKAAVHATQQTSTHGSPKVMTRAMDGSPVNVKGSKIFFKLNPSSSTGIKNNNAA